MTTPSQDVAKLAFRFVLIIGIVNFFADMTYEGARSIVGPFLGSLGASAARSAQSSRPPAAKPPSPAP
jgi:hypothetical protein